MPSKPLSTASSKTAATAISGTPPAVAKRSRPSRPQPCSRSMSCYFIGFLFYLLTENGGCSVWEVVSVFTGCRQFLYNIGWYIELIHPDLSELSERIPKFVHSNSAGAKRRQPLWPTRQRVIESSADALSAHSCRNR